MQPDSTLDNRGTRLKGSGEVARPPGPRLNRAGTVRILAHRLPAACIPPRRAAMIRFR